MIKPTVDVFACEIHRKARPHRVCAIVNEQACLCA